MPILSDSKGCSTPEGRSIALILKKVFFRENPKVAKAVYQAMLHMEKHHGLEFVVSFMKEMKSRIISNTKLPRTKNRWFLKGIKMLDRTMQLKLLAMYSRWTAKTPGRRSYEKFVKEIKARTFSRDGMYKPKQFRFSRSEMWKFNTYTSKAKVKWKPLFSQGAHVLEDNTVAEGEQHIADEIYAMTDAPDLFIEFSDIIQEIFDISDPVMFRLHEVATRKIEEGRNTIGQIIGLTKDGGLKTRYVANLIKGWQVVISPLVGFYKFIEEHYPQSANWSQVEGAMRAASATKDGFNLSSFDVVSSTDNIPRDLFWDLLDPVIEQLPQDKGGNLLRKAYKIDKALCERGVYLTPFSQSAWYSVGQAMGRWTSKSQLNLTMIMASKSCGGTYENSAINGDDVIIWDDQVSYRFEELLEMWEIPISQSKSFIRMTSGEFSGRIITREDGILPVFKGRKTNLVDDPLGLIRQYGHAGFCMLPKSLQKVVKRTAKFLNDDNVGWMDPAQVDRDEGMGPDVQTFLTEKHPVLESKNHIQQFVEQKFESERTRLEEEYSTTVKGLAPTGFMPGFVFPAPASLAERLKAAYERSEQLHGFKDVAVKRFQPRNIRLDVFIENLNSRTVRKTSDGHTIPNFGNGPLSKVIDRLMVDDLSVFQGHSNREAKTKEERLKRVKVLNRLDRKIRRWNKSLNNKTIVKGSLFERFIDWFFGRQ